VTVNRKLAAIVQKVQSSTKSGSETLWTLSCHRIINSSIYPVAILAYFDQIQVKKAMFGLKSQR